MANILSIESSILLWAAIVDDLQKMQSFLQLDKINTQFYRRIIVRNFVSIIEAYLNISKEIIKLRIVSENSHTLKWEELAILSGQKAKLEFNGDVKLKDDFQSFVPHIKSFCESF